MRLGIDVREACRTPLTGKGRWTMGFVTALHARGIPMILLSDRPLSSDLLNKWKGADVRVINASGIFWHLQAKKLIVEDPKIDAYVSTVSYIVPWLLRGRKPCVTIVHDLIAFRSDIHDRRATLIERLTLRPAVRHSALVCAISETTARDLLHIIPTIQKKTVAVFAGCDRAPVKAPTDGDGPIVCIGTLCPRKNQLGLIRAFARLPEALRTNHPLLLVGGRGWHDEEIVEAANSTPHVSWKGQLGDAERDAILKDAVLCAFPSLYEGFGLPVLEAFCAGIPVLTSKAGALAEVAGDAAYIVDPEDESSITTGLQSFLEHPETRREYAVKGLKRAQVFSWDRTADLFVKALERIDR